MEFSEFYDISSCAKIRINNLVGIENARDLKNNAFSIFFSFVGRDIYFQVDFGYFIKNQGTNIPYCLPKFWLTYIFNTFPSTLPLLKFLC